MSKALDILALEPFYGGVRRQMLETLMRLSRHQWTLLKLPPRRVERRLAASARWFAELLPRVDLKGVDLLFTSEMLNLPELKRLVPALAQRPSVVYFHDNQTPTIEQVSTGPLDMINLNNAMAATEVWFNSQYHQDSFLAKASALVERVPEIAGRNPVSELLGKTMVMPPPVDMGKIFGAMQSKDTPVRDARTLFADLRGIDVRKLAEVLHRLDLRGEPFHLITVGPQRGLPAKLPRTVISERDETGQYQGLSEAAVYVGLNDNAMSDELLIPALVAGCWPVVPDAGVHSELLPPSQHLTCLHDGSVESVVSCILDAWYGERPFDYEAEQQDILSRMDAIECCRMFDDLLEEVAAGRAVRA
jgi:hypothetical protein